MFLKLLNFQDCCRYLIVRELAGLEHQQSNYDRTKEERTIDLSSCFFAILFILVVSMEADYFYVLVVLHRKDQSDGIYNSSSTGCQGFMAT